MFRCMSGVVLFVGLAVAFVVRLDAATPELKPVSAQSFVQRDGIGNTLAKLQAGERVKVAYLGGSITAAPGWRVKTLAWLQEKYPKATIEEINAAIGGTGSDLGVFRYEHDALRHQPDLVFVEFAVNDGGAAPENIWRAMEGIVRQTWATNPRTDICFVYTYRVGYEKELREGLCPRAAASMEMLAEHYRIPSINFALEVVKLQSAGKLIFQADASSGDGVIQFSQDGVHPLDGGHQIYSDCVAAAFRRFAEDAVAVDHQQKLPKPFVDDHWQAAKMVAITPAMLRGDWKALPADMGLAKSFGGRMGTIWEASEPKSQLQVKFRGSIARVYDLLGPDGGQVVVTVDGKQRDKPVPRFDSYCTYHRIATLSVAEGVDAEKVHTVTIEIHPDQPDRSPVAFRLKNPDEELKGPKYQGTNVRMSHILVLGDIVE